MALTKIKLDSMITGTLPDANIPDNITITNLSGTNTGDQTLPTASTLSGTTLKSTVVTSSLTSVGTLTNFRSTGIDDNADATAITIDSSERVGIGISSSITDPLHVKTTAVETRISLESSTGKWAIGAEDGDKFGILNYGTSTPFLIDSAGTIFQGTTSPTLHSAVRGIVFENGALLNDVTRGASKSITLAQNVAIDSGNTWAYLAEDEASYYQQYGGNHYFATCALGSAGTDATLTSKLTILNNGNVGVGTSSPSRPLHSLHAGGEYNFLVEGITSGHCGIEIKNNVASNTNILFRNPSYTQELYMDSSGDFHIYRGGNNFTLSQSGNATFAGNVIAKGRMFVGSGGNPLLHFSRTTGTESGMGINYDISPNQMKVVNNYTGGSGSSGSIQLWDGESNDSTFYGHIFPSANNTKSIGSTSNRFNKLHIDSILFHGDTAVANELDDYEEGTWTADPNGGSSLGNATGYYIKIGQTVHFTWYSGAMTGNGNSSYIDGLPFTARNGTEEYWVFSNGHDTWSNGRGGYVNKNSTRMYFVVNDSTATATSDSASGKYVMVTGTYGAS